MFRITNDGGRSKQDIIRELVGKTRCARRTIPLSEASRCAKNSHALHGICSCFGRLELHAAVQLRNAKKVFLWAKGLVCLDPTCNGPIVTTVQSVLASSNQSGETQGAGDAHVVIPQAPRPSLASRRLSTCFDGRIHPGFPCGCASCGTASCCPAGTTPARRSYKWSLPGPDRARAAGRPDDGHVLTDVSGRRHPVGRSGRHHPVRRVRGGRACEASGGV